MKRNLKNAIIVVIAIILVVSSAFIYYGEVYRKSNQITKGPGFELSLLPSHVNNSTRFIGASVQIYMNAPPTHSRGIETFENVSPLFNGIVNSTGNLTSNLSYSFFSYLENWYLYFSSTNNSGANAALTAQITYYFYMDNKTYVSYYTKIISFNPAYYVGIYNLMNKGKITIPVNKPYIKITVNPYMQHLKLYKSPSTKPMGIGGPGGPPWWMWALEKENTFSNYPIPLAWANNSILENNSEEIATSVFLGIASQAAYFHPGGVSYVNGSYSYNTFNDSFYTTPYVDGQYAAGTIPYNALPLKEGQPTAVMLYVRGSLTIDVYKEYYYSIGGWQPTNNIQSITGISSVNISSQGYILMGYMNLTRGTTWSLMEPHNLVRYLISSSYIKSGNYWRSNGQVVQWGTIVDSISSASSNIWPEIDSSIGLALSAIGVIAAADGWAPGSGWSNLASDVLAFAGLASSIYGFVEGMVTNADDNVALFGGAITLQNLPSLGSPNSLEFNVTVNDMPMTIVTNPDGQTTTGQLNIPVYDIVAVAS